MFFYSDLSIYMYFLTFRLTIDFLIFVHVTGHCLYMYAWITTLDHIHVLLSEHANWLYFTYSLGYFLTTLDLHVQILESELWWPYCSWSECTTEASISGCLLGAPFLLAPFDQLARFSSFYSYKSFYIVYHTFALLGDIIFLEYCNIFCDNCVFVLLLLECILSLCFRTLILTYTDA